MREKEFIIDLEKVKERLNGYGCGYHKQLEKQINNLIKKWRRLENE